MVPDPELGHWPVTATPTIASTCTSLCGYCYWNATGHAEVR